MRTNSAEPTIEEDIRRSTIRRNHSMTGSHTKDGSDIAAEDSFNIRSCSDVADCAFK